MKRGTSKKDKMGNKWLRLGKEERWKNWMREKRTADIRILAPGRAPLLGPLGKGKRRTLMPLPLALFYYPRYSGSECIRIHHIVL